MLMAEEDRREEQATPKHFEGQHDNEHVDLVFRQHPIVLRKALILFLVIFAATALPMGIFPPWPIWNSWQLNTVFAGLGLAILVFAYRYVGYHFSVYILTNLRLIEIRQKGFFDRRVTDIGLNKIQSINYEATGVQATLFHFGTIIVQTFVGDLTMPFVHRPAEIQQRMVESIRKVNPDIPDNETLEGWEEGADESS